MGEPDRPAPATRSKQPLAPGLAVLADQLSELLETRVTVELGRRRGKVVIQFGSIDDLERIAGMLGVPKDHSPDQGAHEGSWEPSHHDGHHEG